MFFEGFSGRHGLALVRITLGALFCASAWDKTMKGWFANPEPMVGSIPGRHGAPQRPLLLAPDLAR